MTLKRKYRKSDKGTKEPNRNLSEVPRGSFYHHLPRARADVLYMFVVLHLTPAQIATARNTSVRAVSKHLLRLRKDGDLDRAHQAVPITGGVVPNTEPSTIKGRKELSLHGLQWRVGIISRSDKYTSLLKSSNQIHYKDSTVMLYDHAVIVSCFEEFNHENVRGAVALSLDWWNRKLRQIEHRTGLVLVKPGVLNIRQTAGHYGFRGDSVALDANSRGEKVRIYAEEDGRLAFQIDASGRFDEAECLHPTTGLRDAQEIWEPTMNDWRSGRVPLPGEVWRILGVMAGLQAETVAGLSSIVKLLQPATGPAVKNEVHKPDYVS